MATTTVNLLKKPQTSKLKVSKYLETNIATAPSPQNSAEQNQIMPITQPLPGSYMAPGQGNSAQLPCHTLSCSPIPLGLQSLLPTPVATFLQLRGRVCCSLKVHILNSHILPSSTLLKQPLSHYWIISGLQHWIHNDSYLISKMSQTG